MSESKNQQQVTVPLTDDSSFGGNFDCPYTETHNSRGEITNTGEDVSIQLSQQGTSYSGTCDNLDPEHTETNVSITLDPNFLNSDDNNSAPESRHSTPAFFLRLLLAIFSCCASNNKSAPVSREAGELQAAIDEFIVGCRHFNAKLLGREIPVREENDMDRMLAVWNTFLQWQQGEWSTSALISSDIKDDIDKFISLLNSMMGEQSTKVDKEWIIRWLQNWNTFLQARAGAMLVTRCGIFLTVIGLFCYLLDMVSDIGMSIYYLYMGQWWQAMLTLVIVYGSIIIHTIMKWLSGQINCTASVDWLRYISSLLVNWPEVKQYGVLCLLEWKLYKSPEKFAHLTPEWHQRRFNVALLKFMEGICEACPQTILQLCLLVPDLYGDMTWTDYLRILFTCVSLCTAAVTINNFEKFNRIIVYIDLPICELVVLHVWAVPVTVSRLLSVALLLTVEPCWGLAGVALHLVLCSVYRCITKGVPRALCDVFAMCQFSLVFFISPFNITGSITYRRVVHAIHFLVNIAATLQWALHTPLASSNPALYNAIICVHGVMFVLGLVGWVLYEKYWPDSYING